MAKRISIFCLAVFGILSFYVPGQEIRDWKPDEEQMRKAMREEILHRIEKKHLASGAPDSALFDFHTNQAYDKIKSRLRRWKEKEGTLFSFLMSLYTTSAAEKEIKEFQETVDSFAYGWAIELRDTLQAEYDDVYFFLVNLIKLNHDLSQRNTADRKVMERLLKEYEIPPGFLNKLAEPEVKEPRIHSGESTFSAIAAIKKAMGANPPDRNQHIMFVLGDRYREQYMFMQDFLEQFLYLFAEYAKISARTKSILQQHHIL